MTNEDQIKWQKQAILEDYFNKTDVKELPSGIAVQTPQEIIQKTGGK
jgi:hypothetical protein